MYRYIHVYCYVRSPPIPTDISPPQNRILRLIGQIPWVPNSGEPFVKELAACCWFYSTVVLIRCCVLVVLAHSWHFVRVRPAKMEIIHISKNPQELRILKPRRSLENNNNLQEVNSIKKCLFGVPEAQDVENLLHEQIKEDWERIKSRFGINIEDIENMETRRLESHTPKKRKLESSASRRSVTMRKRRLFEPYNDRKITGESLH
jgi:hypothetical protein